MANLENINTGWTGLKFTSPEVRKSILNDLRALLSERYENLSIDRNGEIVNCFRLKNGDIIFPGFFYTDDGTTNYLVVEYAGDVDEVKQYLEEEGEFFLPEDYGSEEELFEAVLKEIES